MTTQPTTQCVIGRHAAAPRLALALSCALALIACESRSVSSLQHTDAPPPDIATTTVAYPEPQGSAFDTPITPVETVGAGE